MSDPSSTDPADLPTTPGPPRALRVLTILRSFDPGGVERVALRLNAAWRAAGVEALVVCGRSDGVLHKEAATIDFEVVRDGGVPDGAIGMLWMMARLPAVIRRTRPDVLFCPGNAYAVVAVAMRLWLGSSCPTIVAKVSNDLERRDMPWPMRQCYRGWLLLQGRLFDHFVGMAEPMRAEIAAAMRVADDRISIIDNPALAQADLARLAALRPAASPPAAGRRWLAVGRLVPQKNYPLLLHAFARIAEADDRLTILGEGPDRAALEALASKLGIADRVALPGHVDPIDDWLADLSAFVLSSDYEGLPAVVIEALAANCPVIATDCSVSMRDLLDNGRLGRLVPVGDVAALAAAMAAPAEPPHGDPAPAPAQAARFTVERAASRYLATMQRATALPQPAGVDAVGAALAHR